MAHSKKLFKTKMQTPRTHHQLDYEICLTITGLGVWYELWAKEGPADCVMISWEYITVILAFA